ncbi:unnamed protein product, partial [marine sediment metagenome]
MLKTNHKHFFYQAIIFICVIFFLFIIDSYQGVLADTKEVYKNIEVFSEVLRKIEKNYVEGADSKKLIYGAIKG